MPPFFTRLLLGALLTTFTLAAGGKRVLAQAPTASPQPSSADARTGLQIPGDTLPIRDREGDFITSPGRDPFDLRDPSAVEQTVEYDPQTNRYIVTERIGGEYFRSPTYLTFEEYQAYRERQRRQAYFDRLQGRSTGVGVGPTSLEDPIGEIDVSNSLMNRLFGGDDVNIDPRGNIDLTLGADVRRVLNPAFTRRQQINGGFDFQMGIQMNVTGTIGKKLQLSANYNNNANFSFDRQLIKVTYNAADFGEDEILQNIEAGNVSLPLRSNLIQGSQGLMGIRADFKFGDLKVTALASQQKTENKQIEIKGGAQFQEFEVRADEYDENRHFLLSHFNRNTFEEALTNLPNITSLFKINRVEVWITNDRNQTEGVRQLAALADLGESVELTDPEQFNLTPAGTGRAIDGTLLPDNGANDLYTRLLENPRLREQAKVVAGLERGLDLDQAIDFERVTARLLSPTEYSFHPELGFVSVNVNVRPDQVLAVAYEYTYNGEVYKVGEFSNDVSTGDTTAQNVLFTKLLKSTTPRVDVPLWDLMMKNFYNIGAYQVNREDFRLDITYEDPGGGQKRFLPSPRPDAPPLEIANEPLIRVFNVDQLNVQLDPQPDGIFDFVPGLTIYPQNGRIMFPVLEPFGDHLEAEISEPIYQQQYVYDILYDSTVIRAREYPEFNRFIIRGSYKSSVSSEISLGAFNIPRGSVRVTAGGQILREGQDYEIDYNIGRIKILNDAYLNSGVPVRVSFEDNAVFGLQQRSMVGLRADYEVNRKLSVGATYLHLFERPFTQKVNIGEDPINNRILGADVVYGDEAPWLTRLVDRIPGISTIAPSTINFSAEGALLKPGHSNAIEFQEGEGGTVYVDDFEGSASGFDLKTPLTAWTLASVPQNNPLFPEAPFNDSTIINANRALLNWYRVDLQGRSEAALNGEEVYGRQIPPQEIFPGRQLNQFQNNALFTFDLSYYPEERGPYNFDIPGGYPNISAGLNDRGQLDRPETRWGGVMRQLTTNDFQAANIEYLEFWVMSPYLDREFGPNFTDGDLYIEFGNISEDIMRDSRLFYEQGLPVTGGSNANRPVDRNNLGNVPRSQPIAPGFDTDPDAREEQDVGFDGLPDAGERDRFRWWLDQLPGAGISASVIADIEADPSNDNFESFTANSETFTPSKYKKFNGFEGNSPVSTGNDFAIGFSTYPDTEDINGDNTLSENEAYFQYRIPLAPDESEVAGGIDLAEARYVTQVLEVPEADGRARAVWYRFKVPLDQFDARVGSIQDFRSIRFMRMYLTGFDEPITLRFGRLDLVRNQWRRYLRLSALRPPGPQVAPPDVDVFFDVDAINIEENAGRQPFGYVLPTGIQRERQLNTLADVRQNEQSQVITVCGLPDGDARAIYKIVNLDMRVFERLRMFVHAEEFDPAGTGVLPRNLDDGDLEMFVRLGSDFQNNYYEYTFPLEFTRAEEVVDGTSREQSEFIWKAANELDIDLKQLVELKKARNANDAVAVTDLFSQPYPNDETRTIAITGNPSLGLVKGVMIGLRNRRGGAAETCAQVWVNEMRLNGLDEQAGAAGLARLDMQLADFGQVSASASASTIGWGALDQKLAERQRESTLVYDVTGSFELGKFLPEASGVRIPTTAVYSNNVRRPEYDPYDLDILLTEKLEEADPADVDSIREQAVDRVVQREINFTNVRKERTSDGAPLPWDISNFSVSYVYNETDRTNPLIELDEVVNHYAALDYAYALPPVTVEPFKKVIENDEYLNLLRDFNFNPLPTRFAFSTTMDRELQSTRYRFTGGDPEFTTFFNRNWTWDRDYVFNWDFSRGLRFQFNATNRSVIDELETFDRANNDQPYDDEFRRDSVWTNVLDFGRTKAYQHRFDVNYTLPTKSIPYLDFANVTAQYSGSYNWNAAALNLDSLGNVITNANQRQARGDLNFEQLYRKIPYLQRIENGPGPGNTPPPRRPTRNRDLIEDGDALGEGGEEDEDDDEPRRITKLERALVRPLLSLRRANVTYSEDYGTTLPGFMPTPEILGLSSGFGAPGPAFAAGYQPEIRNAIGRNYLYQQNDIWSNDIRLNQQVYQTYSQNLAVQVSAEPFKDFRVDLDLTQRFTENHSEFFKDTLADENSRRFERLVPTEVGSYTISYGALSTLFGNDPEDLFTQFETARLIVSERLGGDELHADSSLASQGYRFGYGPQQQEVQLAAFLAAYTDQDPRTVKLDVFKTRPKVNWRLTYNGLSRLPVMKEWFASFSLTHSYKSTLTINSFNTNLLYDGPETINPVSKSYYTQLVIPDLVITEQFAPLLGVDARLKNDMSIRVSVSKSRSLGMSFVDNRLAERNSEEYSLGYGYTIKNVDLLQYFNGNRKRNRRGRRGRGRDDEEEPSEDADGNPRQRQRGGGGVGNDLDIQLDVRYADDETINRQLDQETSQPTRGAKTFTLSPSAEYEVNRQLSLRLFVDYRTQTPANSISFPTRSTQAGLTIRFKLAP